MATRCYLREGKKSVLATLASRQASGAQRTVMSRYFGKADLTEEHACRLREVFVETGALQQVQEMIDERTRRAIRILDRSSVTCEVKAELEQFAQTLAYRAK
jgi:geranylgeranyl diphosphate synthase type I